MAVLLYRPSLAPSLVKQTVLGTVYGNGGIRNVGVVVLRDVLETSAEAQTRLLRVGRVQLCKPEAECLSGDVPGMRQRVRPDLPGPTHDNQTAECRTNTVQESGNLSAFKANVGAPVPLQAVATANGLPWVPKRSNSWRAALSNGSTHARRIGLEVSNGALTVVCFLLCWLSSRLGGGLLTVLTGLPNACWKSASMSDMSVPRSPIAMLGCGWVPPTTVSDDPGACWKAAPVVEETSMTWVSC
jgi:hypothetical protein